MTSLAFLASLLRLLHLFLFLPVFRLLVALSTSFSDFVTFTYLFRCILGHVEMMITKLVLK